MNCLSTSFDNRMSSSWKSDDDGRSGGEGLVVVDARKEGKDRREIRWVVKQESSQRDAEYLSLVRGPLFSGWSVDGKVLMGVAVGIWAKVDPRFWEYRSDGGEAKRWRWGLSGEFFVLCDSVGSCLIVDGGVRSGGPMDRSSGE